MGIFSRKIKIGKMMAKKDAIGLIKVLKNAESYAKEVPVLLRTTKTEEIRRKAEEALVGIGGGAVEPLIQALRDKDSYVVRRRVAIVLGEIRDVRAVEPLIQALSDEDVYVRVRAAEALGKIGDKRAAEPLIQALKSKYPDVQEFAKDALAKIKQRKIEND